ncbi:MAG TPA: hypothetical protein VFI29_09900 [Hanamia sp.]|nr:hypothetical protein [Hanamia sp.]
MKYLTYKQYPDEFDFIRNTFFKSSVLKGSFDKFVVSDTNKKGAKSFSLRCMNGALCWHKILRYVINQQLNEDELNFVVHKRSTVLSFCASPKTVI